MTTSTATSTALDSLKVFLDSILTLRVNIANAETDIATLQADLAADPWTIDRYATDDRPNQIENIQTFLATDRATLAAHLAGPHKRMVRTLIAAAEALDAGTPGGVLQALAHAAEYRGRQDAARGVGSVGYWKLEADNFRRASRQTTPF